MRRRGAPSVPMCTGLSRARASGLWRGLCGDRKALRIALTAACGKNLPEFAIIAVFRRQTMEA